MNFYHLTKSPLEKALPKLMEKVVQHALRAVILAKDEVRVEQLNQQLWTYTTKFFLPHGSIKDGFIERQPIFLTHHSENPNNASVIAMIDDSEPESFDKFDKAFYLFDGQNPHAVSAARTKWSAYKAKGFALKYWQQTDKGAWQENKAA